MAAQTSDLERVLAQAEQSLLPVPMPPASLSVRLRTSTPLRRLLPRRLAIARAQAKGRAAWEHPGEREQALATMNAILAGTSRAGEVQQLARRRLIEEAVQQELFWQPWRAVSMDPASSANLKRTLASDRRKLVSALHMGPYFLTMSAFAGAGHSTIVVSAPWFFQTPTPDYWGRRMAHWRKGVRLRGERLMCSGGSFANVKALLERGEIVMNYFDMPGSQRTHFLGKPVMLTGGSAQLAYQTEALILPVRPRRVAGRVWVDVSEPLDPLDFAGPHDLHVALAEVQERRILELPETLEDPNRAGAWEHGASADEWAVPQAGAQAPSPPERQARTGASGPG
jgi:lauroyl/myristoyl acyltransferase